MILGRKVAIPLFILFLLFTSMFTSLVSIYSMPERMMGGGDIYVLTFSKDKNPIRSNLDLGIAYGLENMSYITAVSPEIFVFTVIDEQAVTIRGVIPSKFLKLENGSIVKGTLPAGEQEAMAGINAARRLNLHIGENLTLYGSFTSSIAIVKITGIFKTSGPADDEIMVSLPTARELAGIQKGRVSIIRLRTNDPGKVAHLMDPEYPKFTVRLNSTSQIYVGEKFRVNATVSNMGTMPGKVEVNVTFLGERREFNLSVSKERNVSMDFTAIKPGRYRITAIARNDIFYYTCYTEISVLLRPALIQGATMAFVNERTTYIITSLDNETVSEGNLTVLGPGEYRQVYDVSGPVNVTFPEIGNYTLKFSGKWYKNSSMNVSVYQREDLGKLAKICPSPVNGTIYLREGDDVRIVTNGTPYYSLDGGSFVEGNVVPLGEMKGNHNLLISVTSGHLMSMKKFVVHIVKNYTPKILPPARSGSSVAYGENLTFTLVDPVPIREIRYSLNGLKKTIGIEQKFDPNVENYTYNLTIRVNETKFSLNLNFTDIWNRTVSGDFTYHVTLTEDIIKPEIIAKDVKIWGGNRTPVMARDNVGVANMSVLFYGHYFNSSSDVVYVSTYFRNGNAVEFVPPGTYVAKVVVYDVSGNRNETEFNITIDNSGERNPPVILGEKYEDLSSGYTLFRAFDNVGILRISCYESSTLIKWTSSDTLNLTSGDLNNGSHHLVIEAVDTNFNYAYYSVVVTKNYTDTTPPEIKTTSLKIWGGNTTVVYATDDVVVSKISVEVFGMYFNGTSRVRVKTSFETSSGVTFVPEGSYTMNVTAWDINGNVNTTSFTLIINNSGEENPPMFEKLEYVRINASENLILRAFDNVGVERIWIVIGNSTHSSNGDLLSVPATYLPCGDSNFTLFAEDLNGNKNSKEMKLFVYDDIPPGLVYNETTIWSGSTLIIRGEDNFRVSNIRAIFQGREYRSNNGTLLIPTSWEVNGIPHYLPEGTYPIPVEIEDSYGNVKVAKFNLTINNSGERIPPVIIGPSYVAMNVTTVINYTAFDNVGVKKLSLLFGGKIVESVNSSTLQIKYDMLPVGTNNVTIVAEDVNGNIAMMNATIIVLNIKKIDINAWLDSDEIYSDQRGILYVDITNHEVPGILNLTVYVDDSLYYQEQMYLKENERRSMYLYLPYLDEGKHRISVNGIALTLTVTKSVVEKLPTDLVLKYSQDLKFTESKGVIYKGFQLSEGNFILVLASLVGVTLILLFLGIHSTTMKSLKYENIGILRAIGASTRQIFIFFLNDAWKYVLLPVFFGIIGGYFLINFINSLNLLTAFGHHLIIVPTMKEMAMVSILSLGFIAASILLIFFGLMRRKVVHMMGREENGRVVYLDELIGGNESP